MREFDRCRILYQQYLKFNPTSCSAWLKFADMEKQLGDTDRARFIYQLATQQMDLDMPELVWKAYIDFEFEEAQYDAVRELYTKLLERTGHVKVWLSWARAEIAIGEQGSTSAQDASEADSSEKDIDPERMREATQRARDVFEKANRALKLKADKPAVILFQCFLDFRS